MLLVKREGYTESPPARSRSSRAGPVRNAAPNGRSTSTCRAAWDGCRCRNTNHSGAALNDSGSLRQPVRDHCPNDRADGCADHHATQPTDVILRLGRCDPADGAARHPATAHARNNGIDPIAPRKTRDARRLPLMQDEWRRIADARASDCLASVVAVGTVCVDDGLGAGATPAAESQIAIPRMSVSTGSPPITSSTAITAPATALRAIANGWGGAHPVNGVPVFCAHTHATEARDGASKGPSNNEPQR